MGQAELILVMPVVVKAPSKRRRRLRRSVFIGLSLPRIRTTRWGRLQQIRRGYQVPYRGRRDDFAFTLCASAFSGFYLPLMALVWLLILRGIAIEFRNQIQNAAWERLWDVVFSASSTLVVVSFGAARGNGGPRRAPRSVGPLLSSVLEQFFHWSGRGHPRRVHAARRRIRVSHLGATRSLVVGVQSRRHLGAPGAASGARACGGACSPSPPLSPW